MLQIIFLERKTKMHRFQTMQLFLDLHFSIAQQLFKQQLNFYVKTIFSKKSLIDNILIIYYYFYMDNMIFFIRESVQPGKYFK